MPSDKFDFIVARDQHWVDTLQAGLDQHFHLTEQIENRDGTDVVVVKSVSLAEPPKLQFLAWQDEWQTNQPGAARHPDGSPVTDATELKWLKNVQTGGMDVKSWHLTPEPRLLKLWFSHPALDANSAQDITLLDDQNNLIPLGAGGSFSGSQQDGNEFNGQPGWYVNMLSPGTGTNLPIHLTVRLRYAIGQLEHTQTVTLIPKHSDSMTLEGNGQLNGVGENIDGRAFVSLAYDAAKMKSRRFGVRAILKDGRELMTGGSWSGNGNGTGVRVEEYSFDLPLSDVAKFIIGTRPIRMMEWTNVVLPK